MHLRFTITFSLFILFCGHTHAQLVVTDTLPNDTLFSTLFSEGVTISNLTFQFCQPSQTGQFNGMNSNIGLDSGVVISTGNVLTAPGPNTSNLTTGSFSFNPQPYLPLSTIGGGPVFDVCVIEFDIVPLCDSIGISYVFASEEYNEFVASNFNDAFAFFISGPGYAGIPGQNIALIPGSATPVAINNVNNGFAGAGLPSTGPCTNCAYYTDNIGGTTVEFDGFTVPMVASAAVIPCQTYHITLAIADVFDASYDSGVFFEVGGIGCITPTLNLSATNSTVLGANVAVEGCVNYGLFTFTLPEPPTDTTVFYFSVGGTATPGVDYQTLPDSIIMPAGVDSVVLPVFIYGDNLLEGTEFLEIYYVDSTICTGQIYRDTAVMQIWDKPVIPDLRDTAFCSASTVQLGFSPASTQTYQWTPSFGLSNDTISNPLLTLNHNGPDALTQTYYLHTTALQGYCLYEDSLEATVYPANFSDFRADSVCEGNQTTFTSNTTFGTLTSYFWDFGDGQSAGIGDPAHLYSSHGIYQAVLLSANNYGCLDTVLHSVLVDSLPVVDFTVDPVCQNSPSVFVNDVRPGVSYAWDFGDGNISADMNPVHQYDTFGIYPVQVIAVTARGCVDSLTLDAEVYQNPEVSFLADFECDGTPVQFQNMTRPGTGNSLTWQWTFGDGSGNTSENPSHLYNTYGSYSVNLSVEDNLGCTDNETNLVVVHALPTADFSADPICEDLKMLYNNLSGTPDGSQIARYQWVFNDGRKSADPNPEIHYADPGIFQTFLKVVTEFGCPDSITRDVFVYPRPRTDFNLEPVCVYDSSHFTYQSRVDSTGTNDVISTFTWDFGDGNTVNDILNPVHVYQSHGFFPVTLTNFTDKGCSSSKTANLEIFPLPPSPRIVHDTVCFSDQATLTAMAFPPIVEVQWFMGEDDQIPFQRGNSYTTPPLPYPQTWYVNSISDFGCVNGKFPVEASLYQNFHAEIQATQWVAEIPNAVITFFIEGNIEVEEFRWNLGDGNISLEAEPVHQYQRPGKYEVIVDMIDRYGCEYRETAVVEIKQVIGIHVPSAFSPNQDGFNDELFIGHRLISDIDFQVFNRWGGKVYETRELDFHWDGRSFQGSALPEGVYIFHLEAHNIHGEEIRQSGTITLVR